MPEIMRSDKKMYKMMVGTMMMLMPANKPNQLPVYFMEFCWEYKQRD